MRTSATRSTRPPARSWRRPTTCSSRVIAVDRRRLYHWCPTTVADAVTRGEGWVVHLANWATAVLYNGLGQYEDALGAAESACEETYLVVGPQVALPELIEAAARTGKSALAEHAMGRLSAMTSIEGADWAAGLEARCRALLSERAEAERWYAEAIDRLRRTPLRPDLARAQLLYGEWLSRENRRVDARQQLHLAHDTFAA